MAGTRDAANAPSTSLPALLHEGSDALFRQFLYDFFSTAKYIEAGRQEFARAIDVTPPQYSMISVVAAHQDQGGITIGDLAAVLHVQSPFVVLHTRTLVSRGILERRPKPGDGRSVLLLLTDEGRRLLEKVRPLVRLANDVLFQSLSGADFRRLVKIFSALASDVVTANQALTLAIHSMETNKLRKDGRRRAAAERRAKR